VHTVHSGGRGFDVPRGGWVTREHLNHPDLHTGVIDRGRDWRNQMFDIGHYHDGDCGPDWFHHDHGFYCGDNFWFGFDLGLMAGWDWSTQPVYVVSPVTGDPIGSLQPPDGGFGDPNAVYQQMLDSMATPPQDPNDPSFDPTAGLYVATPNFDPTNPGDHMSGDDAFSALGSGQPIYFHPPNGDWEQISSLDDLNAYLYTQELQSDAPPQQD
jgi:hypothetical protein